MIWFKVTLLVYLGMRIVFSIYQAGKGKHNTELTPIGQIVSAIINSAIMVGILIYL